MNKSRHRRHGPERIVAIVATAFVALVAIVSISQWRSLRIAAVDALELRYLAGSATFAGLGAITPDFDVTEAGIVQLAPARGGLLSITPNGRAYLFPVSSKPLTSFALDEADNPLTIAGGFLGRLTETGEALQALPLPTDGARLARSVHRGAFYLFGEYGGEWRVYRFWENGRFEVLLSSPRAIAGVVDSGSALYVATARRIYRLGGDGRRIVFQAPDSPAWGPITSVAVTLEGQVLFATPHQVWAVAHSGAAGTLINDAGGQIRLRGGRVFVLDLGRRLLFSFAPRKGTSP